MKKSLLILLFIVVGSISGNAQKLELTQQDRDEFKRRAVRMIELFKESLTIIPSFNSEPILKDKAIKNTLRLFTKDATMTLAYASGKISGKIRIPTYLSSLTAYEAKRELVNIEIIDFTIEDIKPHPTQLGKYIIEFEFVQLFQKKKNYVPDPLIGPEGLKELEWDYVDKTTKKGTGIIEKVATSDGTKWMMLLGDIEAQDIEVIKN